MDLSEEAALLSRGLHGRFVTPAETARWADKWIAALPDVPPCLFDVSLGAGRTEPEVADFLSPLTRGFQDTDLVPATLGLMGNALAKDNARAASIAEALWQLDLSGVLPQPVGARIGAIKFPLEDACDEEYGSYPEVLATLAAALEPYRHLVPFAV